MSIYSANCSGYSDGCETGFRNIVFTGDSDEDAIMQAAKFLQNRCKALELKPGCIKVQRFPVVRIAENGEYQGARSFPFFEWKCDTSPYSLKELIDSMDARGASR